MYWTRSGDLIVMVVLGGMASRSEPCSARWCFWCWNGAFGHHRILAVILGPLLLLVVLFARGGIDGLLVQLGARWQRGSDKPELAKRVRA